MHRSVKITIALLCIILLAFTYMPDNSYISSDTSLHRASVIGQTFFVVGANNDLISWGKNDYNLVSPRPLPSLPYFTRHTIMKDATMVQANSTQAIAINKNNELFIWGKESCIPHNGKFTKVLDDVKDASVGLKHIVALKSDGSLWVCGDNSYGQLGAGFRDDKTYPPHKVMDNAISVYTFGNTVFAIRRDNALFAWGGYMDQKKAPLYAPAKVADNIQAVSYLHGSKYQLLTIDGTILCFDSEQIGPSGSFTTKSVSDVPLEHNVRSLCNAGFIKKDGSFWMWSTNRFNDSATFCATSVQDAAACTSGNYLFIDATGIVHVGSSNGHPHVIGTLKSLSSFFRNLTLTCIVAVCISEKFRNHNRSFLHLPPINKPQ